MSGRSGTPLSIESSGTIGGESGKGQKWGIGQVRGLDWSESLRGPGWRGGLGVSNLVSVAQHDG